MFDETARELLRSGELVVEARIPSGIGPNTLARHPDWWAPEVLELLQRREESRGLAQRVYELAKNDHDMPAIAWREQLDRAMNAGEYGSKSEAASRVRMELENALQRRAARVDAWTGLGSDARHANEVTTTREDR